MFPAIHGNLPSESAWGSVKETPLPSVVLPSVVLKGHPQTGVVSIQLLGVLRVKAEPIGAGFRETSFEDPLKANPSQFFANALRAVRAPSAKSNLVGCSTPAVPIRTFPSVAGLVVLVSL